MDDPPIQFIQPAIQFLTTCSPAPGTTLKYYKWEVWLTQLYAIATKFRQAKLPWAWPEWESRSSGWEWGMRWIYFQVGLQPSCGWGWMKRPSRVCCVYSLTLLWCHWPEGYYGNQSNFYVQDSKGAWSSDKAGLLLMENLQQDWMWKGKTGKVVVRWHVKITYLFIHLTAFNKV